MSIILFIKTNQINKCKLMIPRNNKQKYVLPQDMGLS